MSPSVMKAPEVKEGEPPPGSLQKIWVEVMGKFPWRDLVVISLFTFAILTIFKLTTQIEYSEKEIEEFKDEIKVQQLEIRALRAQTDQLSGRVDTLQEIISRQEEELRSLRRSSAVERLPQ